MYGAIGLIVLFFATMPVAGVRHARLARKRMRIDEAGFIRLMDGAGVSSTTARFLWQGLAPFYHAPLTARPDDRLESLIGIDRPEIEAMIMRFWATMRGADAFPLRAPLDADPSAAELGRHLDSLTGWTVRAA